MKKQILLTQLGKSDKKLSYNREGYFTGFYKHDQIRFDDPTQQTINATNDCEQDCRVLVWIRFQQYAEIYKL